MSTNHLDESDNNRRRGTRRIRFGVTVVSLVAIGAVAWWNLAGWRVERTNEGQICGIEKDLYHFSGFGSVMAKYDTLDESCEALFSEKLVKACHATSRDAVDKCRAQHPLHGPARIAIQPFQPAQQAVFAKDSGVWASLIARLTEGWISISQKLTGADGINTCANDQSNYDAGFVVLGAESCLGAAVDDRNIVTAAHCLSFGQNTPAKYIYVCPTDGSTTGSMDCTPASNDRTFDPNDKACRDNPPPSRCAADIARCSLSSVEPTCLGRSVDAPPRWDAPPNPLPTTVQILNQVPKTCIKLDQGTPESSTWPTAAKPGVLMADIMEFGGFTLIDGDSGGGVYATGGDGKRMLLGIQRTTGEKAQIIPLYLWPNLQPSAPAAGK
jgi:hypothetical protein